MNNFQKKKNFFVKSLLCVILIFFASVLLIANHYFCAKRREEFKIIAQLPVLSVEKTTSNQDLILIPLGFPLLADELYTHLSEVNFEIKVDPCGMTIKKPIYLKVTVQIEKHNDFPDLTKAFNYVMKVGVNSYDDQKKPQFIFGSQNKAIMLFTFQLQYLEYKQLSSLKPLIVNFIFEAVDQEGKSFAGGQRIQQKITQTS